MENLEQKMSGVRIEGQKSRGGGRGRGRGRGRGLKQQQQQQHQHQQSPPRQQHQQQPPEPQQHQQSPPRQQQQQQQQIQQNQQSSQQNQQQQRLQNSHPTPPSDNAKRSHEQMSGQPPPAQSNRPQQVVRPRDGEEPRRSEQHQPQGNVRVVTQEEVREAAAEEVLLPAKRPCYGTRSTRQIRVHANHFPIRVRPDAVIEHYDVIVKGLPTRQRRNGGDEGVEDDGDKVSKGMANRLFTAVQEKFPRAFGRATVAFDDAGNVFANQPLNLDDIDPETGASMQTFEVQLDPRKPPIRVIVKHRTTVLGEHIQDYQNGRDVEMPASVVDAINTILRKVYLDRQEIVPGGRAFFIRTSDADKQNMTLDGGREIWYGFKSSARAGAPVHGNKWKAINLNMDMTATTFIPRKPLLQYIHEVLSLRQCEPQKLHLMDRQVDKLRKELKGMKVDVQPYGKFRKQTKKINNIAMRGADCDNIPGLGKTVAQYFQTQYGIKLTYPKLQCIQVGMDGKAHLPMELCTVVEQRGGRKMSGKQTSVMIRKTAIPPVERKKQIEAQIQRSQFANSAVMRDFGIEVSPKMLELGARVLPAPQIQYKDGPTVQPSKGSWNPKNVKFYKSTSEPISNWGMINFCNRTQERELGKFLDMLLNLSRQLGMEISPPNFTEKLIHPTKVEEAFEYFRKNGCKFLVCVIPDIPDSDLYERIKYNGNIQCGIVTSCVRSETLNRKCNQQVLDNYLKKVNAKLGGINHVPRDPFLSEKNGVMSEPTMIMGADVTHPPPGDKSKPSIAAVTGSVDGNAMKYTAMASVQNHRVEMIADMKYITRQLLLAFYRYTRQKPRKIIMYRDGVGDTQQMEVLKNEMGAMRAACQELEPGYEPGITFILVLKRHHTRMMPANHQDGVGRMGNVPAGTILDHGVTNPDEFDFFVVMHEGIQGTSKPAYIKVLHDDNSLSGDDVEALTFYLAHCYSNCSRSVSNPAPAYYAHKVADLSMKHLKNVLHNDTSSDQSGSSVGEPTDEMRDAVNVHADLSQQMYFL